MSLVEQELTTPHGHLCTHSVLFIFFSLIALSLLIQTTASDYVFGNCVVLFLAIVLSVLQITASDFPFDIVKLFWV